MGEGQEETAGTRVGVKEDGITGGACDMTIGMKIMLQPMETMEPMENMENTSLGNYLEKEIQLKYKLEQAGKVEMEGTI